MRDSSTKGATPGNIWGRHSSRAPSHAADYGASFHLLRGIDHGEQTVRCDRTVDVRDTYHCDPASGRYARPCLGDVCPDCEALLDQREGERL